jgi:hypothetical protein
MAPTSTLQNVPAQKAREIKVPLQSNGFKLDMSNKRLGWLTPTDPALPVETLREIFKKQGSVRILSSLTTAPPSLLLLLLL